MLDKFGELADKLTAHPMFLVLFNVALVALWVLLGVDFANIFISIITAEIVLLSASSNRRGQIAMQAKLDEIIKSVDNARDDLIGLEKKQEKEIEELRV